MDLLKAAGDAKHDARDIGGFPSEQPGDGCGYLVRIASPAKWNVPRDPVRAARIARMG
jgi:hypothetical protein